MKITTQCTSCLKTLAVDATHAGKKIRCPVCKEIVQLPRSGTVAKQTSESPKVAPKSPKQPSPEQRSSASRRKPSEGRSRDSQPQRRQREAPSSERRSRRRNSAQRRGRPSDVHPDDIWNQPLSSQGAAIEPEDYDDYGLPPRRKKKKRDRDEDGTYRSERRPSSSSSSMGAMTICAIVCGICILLALAAIPVSSSAPDVGKFLAMPAAILGGLLYVGGGLSILGNAFSEDSICGFLYLFVPLYPIYFLISRWDVNAKPFFAALMGALTGVIGLFCGAM